MNFYLSRSLYLLVILFFVTTVSTLANDILALKSGNFIAISTCNVKKDGTVNFTTIGGERKFINYKEVDYYFSSSSNRNYHFVSIKDKVKKVYLLYKSKFNIYYTISTHVNGQNSYTTTYYYIGDDVEAEAISSTGLQFGDKQKTIDLFEKYLGDDPISVSELNAPGFTRSWHSSVKQIIMSYMERNPAPELKTAKKEALITVFAKKVNGECKITFNGEEVKVDKSFRLELRVPNDYTSILTVGTNKYFLSVSKLYPEYYELKSRESGWILKYKGGPSSAKLKAEKYPLITPFQKEEVVN
ncbi:hypothetical protein [Flammeovirga sp. SubArs3]|uniref:hypothetical protein n=1 Tax=Flammeovirga sp. SubArs3 TaxID=2995316 RepID=UPI00248C9D46|nr:hypothetical protein [Flammeovirga sp. SubArs3]